MDNYKPYNDINELRKKAVGYLKSIRNGEYSLEETNPHLKFRFTNEAIWHITAKSGIRKLLITQQLPDIFRQGIIHNVENDKRGDGFIVNVIKCVSYIMLEDEIFAFYYTLKIQKDGRIYIYDGSINVNAPEKKNPFRIVGGRNHTELDT